MSSSKNILRGGAGQPALFRSVAEEHDRMERSFGEMGSEAERQKLRDEARLEGYQSGMAKGFDAGFAKGMKEGRELGTQQAHAEILAETEVNRVESRAAIEEMIAAMQKFADDAYDAIRQWKEEAAQAHAKVGLMVAERAVGEELHVRRDVVIGLARQALAELHQGLEFRILVNPMDVSLVDSHAQELIEALTHVRGIEVVPDRSIAAGCLVESHTGAVDARIETYLQRMAAAALTEVREAA